MPWAHVETELLLGHPKVAAIEERYRATCVALYIGLIAFSVEHLTDGRVLVEDAKFVARGLGEKRPTSSFQRLVRVRLLRAEVAEFDRRNRRVLQTKSPTSTGTTAEFVAWMRRETAVFVLDDFLEFHRSREVVEEERERIRERKRTQRRQGKLDVVPMGQEQLVPGGTVPPSARVRGRDTDGSSISSNVVGKPVSGKLEPDLPFHLELLIADAGAVNASAETIRRAADGLPEAAIARAREALRERRPRPDVPAAYVVTVLGKMRAALERPAEPEL